MKSNIVPFVIIAVIGVMGIIILSSIGVSQRADIQNEDENGAETEEAEEAEAQDPEEIFANNCASCHGDDLSGESGPDLTSVGSDLSEDDIHDVIMNGQGSMPPGLIEGEEADEVAAWLAEMK